MGESPGYPKVWLYDGGTWQQVDDPIDWGEGGGVTDFYAEYGYCDKDRQPAVRIAAPESDVVSATELRLWVREEHPQCVIDIEWSGRMRSVYAARFPDGLDLMARWAPILRHGATPGHFES